MFYIMFYMMFYIMFYNNLYNVHTNSPLWIHVEEELFLVILDKESPCLAWWRASSRWKMGWWWWSWWRWWWRWWPWYFWISCWWQRLWLWWQIGVMHTRYGTVWHGLVYHSMVHYDFAAKVQWKCFDVMLRVWPGWFSVVVMGGLTLYDVPHDMITMSRNSNFFFRMTKQPDKPLEGASKDAQSPSFTLFFFFFITEVTAWSPSTGRVSWV